MVKNAALATIESGKFEIFARVLYWQSFCNRRLWRDHNSRSHPRYTRASDTNEFTNGGCHVSFNALNAGLHPSDHVASFSTSNSGRTPYTKLGSVFATEKLTSRWCPLRVRHCLICYLRTHFLCNIGGSSVGRHVLLVQVHNEMSTQSFRLLELRQNVFQSYWWRKHDRHYRFETGSKAVSKSYNQHLKCLLTCKGNY